MLDLETNEAITFQGPVDKQAYLKSYNDIVSGARGKGVVKGVNLLYKSDQICEETTKENYSLTIAVECTLHS